MDTPGSVEQQINNLNRFYYHGLGPADYLTTRLNMLCLAAGAFDQCMSILDQGIEYDGNNIRLAEGMPTEEQGNQFEKHFLRIESHHLRHLALETLLRLFIGHKGHPVCPWIEISKVTKFRKIVKRQIVDAELAALQSDVRQTILGLPSSRDSMTEEQKKLDVSEIVAEFVLEFAREWLEEAKSYNATKHGLTAIPGEEEISLGPEGEEPITLASGDSLTHLVGMWERESKTLLWSRNTRWINVMYAIVTVYSATALIRAIWNIGRARYGLAAGFKPLLWSPDHTIDEMRERFNRSGEEMSITLFEEVVRVQAKGSVRLRE